MHHPRSIGIFLPAHKFLNPTNNCHSIPKSNMKIANQGVVHALLFFVLVSYPSSIEAGKQGGPKSITAVKSLRRILQDETTSVSEDEASVSQDETSVSQDETSASQEGDSVSSSSDDLRNGRSIQGPTQRECEFCK
jgi:hypothetical protein